MALDDAGGLIDPFGGKEHLAEKLLETPSPAAEIFGEDPLRMLRAARFISQLGFEPLPQVRAAVRGAGGRHPHRLARALEAGAGQVAVGEAAGAALAFLAQTGCSRSSCPRCTPCCS